MDIRQNFVGSGSQLGIKTEVDVTGLLTENKDMRENGKQREGMKLAARVDMASIMRWGNEDFKDPNVYFTGRSKTDPDVAAKLARRLNMVENKNFRIWEGNIGKSDILSKR